MCFQKYLRSLHSARNNIYVLCEFVKWVKSISENCHSLLMPVEALLLQLCTSPRLKRAETLGTPLPGVCLCVQKVFHFACQ